MAPRFRRNALDREAGAVADVEVDIDEWWRIRGGSSSTGRGSRSRSSSGSVPVPSSESDGKSRALLHRDLLLGGRNTARKLMCREIGQLRGRMPPRPDELFCTEKFRRFRPQQEFFVGMEHPLRTVPISVSEITVANDFIFVVASSGVCIAFQQTKNGYIAPYVRDGQIWQFNNLDEVVMLVFYNKINDSIIIVSCTRNGNDYESRALPLESIRRCDHWDNGVQIFGVRSICMPVFYDQTNIAVVPQSISVLNVHEMNNYNLVHSFRSKEIIFVTSRPGILMIAYRLSETYISIDVLSTEKWTLMKKINYEEPPRGFELIWICEDNIILKEQDKQTVHMFDIWNDNSVRLIKQTDKRQKLLAISDLAAKRLLLRFNENIIVASCNSHDEPLALLEDNEVPGNDDYRYFAGTYVTKDNKYAMIYSRKHIKKPRKGIKMLQAGSINIYNTFNGESVWKINPCDDVDLAIAAQKEHDTNIPSIIHEALEDITTLFYDEDRHRIYTGNIRGFFHVWSN